MSLKSSKPFPSWTPLCAIWFLIMLSTRLYPAKLCCSKWKSLRALMLCSSPTNTTGCCNLIASRISAPYWSWIKDIHEPNLSSQLRKPLSSLARVLQFFHSGGAAGIHFESIPRSRGGPSWPPRPRASSANNWVCCCKTCSKDTCGAWGSCWGNCWGTCCCCNGSCCCCWSCCGIPGGGSIGQGPYIGPLSLHQELFQRTQFHMDLLSETKLLTSSLSLLAVVQRGHLQEGYRSTQAAQAHLS